jgi:hypothetical protein
MEAQEDWPFRMVIEVPWTNLCLLVHSEAVDVYCDAVVSQSTYEVVVKVLVGVLGFDRCPHGRTAIRHIRCGIGLLRHVEVSILVVEGWTRGSRAGHRRPHIAFLTVACTPLIATLLSPMTIARLDPAFDISRWRSCSTPPFAGFGCKGESHDRRIQSRRVA